MPQKNLKRVTTSKKKTTENNVKFKPSKIHIVEPFKDIFPKENDELCDMAIKFDENEQALFDRYKIKRPYRKIPQEARILIYKMAKELGYWNDGIIDLVNKHGRPSKWAGEFGCVFYQRVQEQKKNTPNLSTNACIQIVQNKQVYQNDYGAIPLETLKVRYKEIKKHYEQIYEQCKDVVDALKEYEPDLQELAKQIQ